MSLAASPVRRVFLYNGRELADPDPSMPPERVRQFYAAIYPDLANAVVEDAGFGGETQTYEMRRAIGTKG